MTLAPELQRLTHSAAVWHRYDPAVKAELWSTAIRAPSGVYLVDPTAVDSRSLAEFTGPLRVTAIVVTNANHLRDAASFSSEFDAALLDSASEFRDPDVTAVELPGAPPGEIALITRTGELVIGDALINFEPYGFTFLPDKYCTQPKQMRQSLRKLLDYEFERILFAHGAPITHNARQRLESLLC